MKLKPVKNYHNLFNRRTCSQCQYWNETHYIDSYGQDRSDGFNCDREGGPEGDWNSIEPEWHVCDRFKWMEVKENDDAH